MSIDELAKAWFLVSFSLGAWTCLNLALSRRGTRAVKATMLAMTVLFLLPPLNAYLGLALQHSIEPLFELSHRLTWAYGPLLLLLVRQALLMHTSPARMAMHALPFLFAVSDALFGWIWVNPLIMLALLLVQIVAYLGRSAFLLRRHRQRLALLTGQHRCSSYYWLLYLVGALFAATLVDMVIFGAILLGHMPSMSWVNLVASMLALFVDTIALFALYQPDIFLHVLPEAEAEAEVEAKVEVDVAQAAEAPPAPRATELSPEAASELDAQLQTVVALHKPHLDDEISLGKLAVLLDVTNHQLSELLNVHKATSFYDFLNELRFKEALQLFSDQAQLTVADIAYRAGFNNRNSFYKVFKEKTGLTPAQYRKSLIAA